MWQVTICYHTISKSTGELVLPAKIKVKLCEDLDMAKRYEWDFYKPSRVIMWTSKYKYVGKLDAWLD